MKFYIHYLWQENQLMRKTLNPKTLHTSSLPFSRVNRTTVSIQTSTKNWMVGVKKTYKNLVGRKGEYITKYSCNPFPTEAGVTLKGWSIGWFQPWFSPSNEILLILNSCSQNLFMKNLTKVWLFILQETSKLMQQNIFYLRYSSAV